ncbi:MAG TPA: glycosyltransferase, partial [Bryobacteraceae bacterium]|nr:glycosyltransferase [Bryobacteraceae bacterium]
MAPPLSIVHIDTAETFRGGQQVLLLLARGLRARGHRQQIVCPANAKLAEAARSEGLDWAPLTSVPKLRRMLHGAQIAHAHSGRAQNLSFFASAGLPVRRIATRHVAFEPRHPRIHRLKYNVTCHGIIAVSKSVQRAMAEAGVPEEKIEIIPNGVEWPERTATQEERLAAR